jgi:hypothetical protein
MIHDYLVPAIQKTFPDKPFVFAKPPHPVASLRSPCTQLGELQICDDGDEATVYITEATHGHFGCYDECLRTEAKEQQIAEDVIAFLSALFADRVVVWRIAHGRVAGGWKRLGPDDPLPKPSLIGRSSNGPAR